MGHLVEILAPQEALLLEADASSEICGDVAHAHHAAVVHVDLAQDEVADGGRHLGHQACDTL